MKAIKIYICTVDSENCETKSKDHELEDGTNSVVPLSAKRHLAAQHPGASSSLIWAENLEDVMTSTKKHSKETNFFFYKNGEAVQFGRAHKHHLQHQQRHFQHSHFRLRLSRRVKTNELGQRCVSIFTAAGNRLGGGGAGEGFCDPERW